jgi:hypothetical protein
MLSRDAFFAAPLLHVLPRTQPPCCGLFSWAGDLNCVTDVQDLQVQLATQQPAQNSRLQGGPALLQAMQTAALCGGYNTKFSRVSLEPHMPTHAGAVACGH